MQKLGTARAANLFRLQAAETGPEPILIRAVARRDSAGLTVLSCPCPCPCPSVNVTVLVTLVVTLSVTFGFGLTSPALTFLRGFPRPFTSGELMRPCLARLLGHHGVIQPAVAAFLPSMEGPLPNARPVIPLTHGQPGKHPVVVGE